MDIEDRIKLIIESEGFTREKFASNVGIAYTRISNIFSGRAKIRHEEIELIGKAYPEFRLWLAFGDELPEAGQISPMTKKVLSDLGKQGKA